jgi:hypothetical protein
MTKEDESTQNGAAPRQAPKEENEAFLLLKNLVKSPLTLKKLRRMGQDEERYVAPARRYELPEYRTGMKYSTSNEPYLRPTRWCNPREPLVVALAHQLGAYELSDREFAEAAYWWVKTNMWYAMKPLDKASATIRRGSGFCYHFANTFVALCRCAGIKARYKGYTMRIPERDAFTDIDSGFADVWGGDEGIVKEAEGEVYLDGTWVTAYVAQTVAMTASMGWPITEFGESSIGLYFDALPESINRFESLSFGFGLSLWFTNLLAPATMERLSARMSGLQRLGLQKIEDAGGLQEYIRIARKKHTFFAASEILENEVLERNANIIIKKSQ